MVYEKCLVQLDEVLNYLSNEDLNKIPYEIRRNIKNQKDKQYIWYYDESKQLKEQKLDRKTVAMLSYLNMEYLLNNKQKALMEEIHDFNERKIEEEKQKNYSANNIFKDRTTDNKEVSEKNIQIFKNKESLFIKIVNKIKDLFI